MSTPTSVPVPSSYPRRLYCIKVVHNSEVILITPFSLKPTLQEIPDWLLQELTPFFPRGRISRGHNLDSFRFSGYCLSLPPDLVFQLFIKPNDHFYI